MADIGRICKYARKHRLFFQYGCAYVHVKTTRHATNSSYFSFIVASLTRNHGDLATDKCANVTHTRARLVKQDLSFSLTVFLTLIQDDVTL